MNMFEKTTKVVKEVGGSVFDSAKNLGSSIYVTSKEQSKLAGIKVQKSVVEKRLMESYAEIGKRYVAYISGANADEAFDVSEIMEAMRPDLEKLAEIEDEIAEKTLNARREEEQRQRRKAQEEFDSEKNKLDKALSMEIISREEYDEKVAVIQKKLDNYDQIRKIEMQLQMGIISSDEYEAKISQLLK